MGREQKLIYTFQTTVDAMRFERAAKEAALPGRIIPAPAAVTAGCGLVWMTQPGQEEETDALIAREGLRQERKVMILW